ncbi:MAG: hypothetical protein K6E59_03130 [Bacilli bacterium]|nr:hypothetical protein [Bacilli bacterium]
MKKGILISGIIWGVSSVIGFLLLLIFGLAATSPEAIKALVDSGYTQADAEAGALVTAVTMIVWAVYLLIAAAFSFVLVGVRNRGFGKGAGITLGVFAVIFGSTLPGIFFIVDSAMNRK